jgi:hypothetical protein
MPLSAPQPVHVSEAFVERRPVFPEVARKLEGRSHLIEQPVDAEHLAPSHRADHQAGFTQSVDALGQLLRVTPGDKERAGPVNSGQRAAIGHWPGPQNWVNDW